MDLRISGPSKIESCDMAAPLIHVKLLEHLHCLTLVSYGGAFSSVPNKMLLGFVAI